MSSRGLFARRKSTGRLDTSDCSAVGVDDGTSACSGQNKGANGIPDWEDPLGNSISASVPRVDPKARPPLRTSSAKLRRSAATSRGQALQQHRPQRTTSSSSRSAAPPAPVSERSQRQQQYDHYYGQEPLGQCHEYENQGYGGPQLENMVIECDHDDVEQCSVGEITYDGSVMYDHGFHHPQPEDHHHRFNRLRTPSISRARSGEIKRPPRHPAMTEELRRGTSSDRLAFDENQENRATGELSLEEEERRLVELAMERSLQETSSQTSSRVSAMEVSLLESMEFGSSRGGSLMSAGSHHDPRYDQRSSYERPGHGDRHSFVWKREGKKWMKVPVPSSDGLQAIKERDDSCHRPSQLSREEQLEIMEQKMFEEAMQRSLSFVDMHGGSNRSLLGGDGPAHGSNSLHHSSDDLHSRSTYGSRTNSKLIGYDEEDDDDIDEDEAMARLMELEEEKSRLKRAMQRRRSLEKKSSRRSRSSETVSVTLSDHSSLHREASLYDGEHDREYHETDRFDGRRPPAEYTNDGYNVDQDSRNNYAHSNSRVQKPASIRRADSTDSRDSEGKKTVWKKDRRGVWGRYHDEQIDADDEESLLADVLKRSMHDQ